MQNRVSASMRDSAHFSAVQQADDNKNINYKNMPVTDQYHGRYIFFSSKFAEIMSSYAQYTFQYRINNAIVNHAKNKADVSKLFLYWEDSKKHYHPLKVTLSHADPFRTNYSRFLTEENLIKFASQHLNEKIDAQANYYRLDVHQRVMVMDGRRFDDILLLTLWFTLDGRIGELRTVVPGIHFSASETLKIFNYFAPFLQIKNLFICDDAELKNPWKKVSVPIRVISALATGKTWFEKHIPGLTLFKSEDIPVGQMNKVSQNPIARARSLRELQALTLQQWHGMLPGAEQQQLYELYLKYFWQKKAAKKSVIQFFQHNKEDEMQAGFNRETVQTLTAAVYQDAKFNKTITSDLLQLTELLCGNMALDFGNIPLNKKAADFWVKSRVRQLMWGSYIWKQTIERTSDQSMDQFKLITGSLLL